jgi:GMP synthase (glutamine-hydrolysing)
VRCLCSDGTPDTAHFEELLPELAAVAERFGIGALALPIRSVGVKADLRAYEHPVLLSGESDWESLREIVSVITAEVPHINRCVLHLGGGRPTGAGVVAGYMTRERLNTLREADAMVMEGLERHGIYDEIWQCPTVLVPLQLEESSGEMIVLRPISSARAMTATPVELPAALIEELRNGILELPGVGSLSLDLTSKPPGTIEWE